jgi:serine protease Do
MADGRAYAGTAFNVAPEGRLITNRHLLVDERGDSARRIAVIFADTRTWLPARLERTSGTADLALLTVQSPGPFPTVRKIGSPAIGTSLAIIGYPLGTGTPMEGTGTAIIARTTLGAGIVSKVLSDVVQIDAFAGQGSSGSPVFNGLGHLVGVVYGGAPESGGRIVYAVPGEIVAGFLRGS